MKTAIKRNGIAFALKVCPGCGDEWYAKRKQNRCTLCGTGLIMRTRETVNTPWDELNPAKTLQANEPYFKLLKALNA